MQGLAGCSMSDVLQSEACDISFISVSGVGDRSDRRQDGKRAHALRAMDEYALDVRRRGRTGVKRGIMPFVKLGPAIGVVQIDDDVGWIEEYDQVLGKVSDSVDAEIHVAQQHGAGLRDG